MGEDARVSGLDNMAYIFGMQAHFYSEKGFNTQIVYGSDKRQGIPHLFGINRGIGQHMMLKASGLFRYMKKKAKVYSMELKKPAMAGTTESSDILITLRPNPAGGIVIDLKSDVMTTFGDAIEATIRQVLREFDVQDAWVSAVDKGALDFAIRARMQCAICRAAEIEYDWSREDRDGK